MPDRGWSEPLVGEYNRRCFRCGYPIKRLPSPDLQDWLASSGEALCTGRPLLLSDGRRKGYGQHEPANDMPDPDDKEAMEQWLER